MHRTSPQAEACFEDAQLKDESLLKLRKNCGNSEVAVKTKVEKVEHGDE